MDQTTKINPLLTNPLLTKFPDLKDVLGRIEWTDGSFEDVPAGKFSMAVMGEPGDTKHIWDRRNADEVEAAKMLYTALTKKGYRAFHVTGKDGEKGVQMSAFDPEAERMIFVPQLAGG